MSGYYYFWLWKGVECEKEALPQPQPCSQAGGSATLRWALIEPADLTFVSLTLRRGQVLHVWIIIQLVHLNHWPLQPRGQAERQRGINAAWAESLFAFQLQQQLHRQTTQQEHRHKSVFCPLTIWIEWEWHFKINFLSVVVLSGNTLSAFLNQKPMSSLFFLEVNLKKVQAKSSSYNS